MELQKNGNMYSFEVDESGDANKNFDDDGREKRTGTLLTASAHIITAVIGSGVLSLAWANAQLGWIVGPIILMVFSIITWFMSTLLADCYRSPDPITGKRNYTYMDVVRTNLGGVQIKLCGLAQYCGNIGVTIGYTITASISMAAIQRSNCFYRNGHSAKCIANTNPFIILFAGIQIVFSQIPNFNKLWFLSIIAAVMSFAYSSIGFGLSIAKVAEGGHVRTTLTGVTVGVDVSGTEKVWRTFQAIGDIAFAYAFSTVLIEIQDTLKSSPPENVVMKKATFIGTTVTTTFYMLCGCIGYEAFGNKAPGNFLTGFGFYDPYWLIDIGNLFVAIHLIGAYQVFGQPFFQFVENWAPRRWPTYSFLTTEHAVKIPLTGVYHMNYFRLIWRTVYVILTALIAMIFPFFNHFVGLLGSIGFWPLTVYFPTELYLAHRKIPRFSATWTCLKLLSGLCLIVSIAAGVSSALGLVKHVMTYKPFQAPH